MRQSITACYWWIEPVRKSVTACTWAEIFLRTLFRLQEMCSMLLSVRGPQFQYEFWHEFFGLRRSSVVSFFEQWQC